MRESAVDKAVRILQAGIGLEAGTEEIRAAQVTLRKLPAGVPVAVVREGWRWVMRFPSVYHTLRKIPDECFELTVAGLSAWKSPASTFLRAVLAVDRSPAALQAANRAFYELGNLPEPYAPSGRKRVELVMSQPIYAAAARAACSQHWSHPLPINPGEKGWNKKAKNILHAGIQRRACECGGYRGDVLCFFRALVYEGGPDSAATLKTLFKRSKASAQYRASFSRFAKSPEMVEVFEVFAPSPGESSDHSPPSRGKAR